MPKDSLSAIRARSGRKGGKATKRKHGGKYFSRISKLRKTRAGGRKGQQDGSST